MTPRSLLPIHLKWPWIDYSRISEVTLGLHTILGHYVGWMRGMLVYDNSLFPKNVYLGHVWDEYLCMCIYCTLVVWAQIPTLKCMTYYIYIYFQRCFQIKALVHDMESLFNNVLFEVQSLTRHHESLCPYDDVKI